MLTTATARHYMEEGFLVLPRVVSPRRAAEHSLELQRHLERHGDRYAMMMDGDRLGGWYIANFPGVPELGHLLEALTRDARLGELLEDLLGASFHLLSRSEIYVDRQSAPLPLPPARSLKRRAQSTDQHTHCSERTYGSLLLTRLMRHTDDWHADGLYAAPALYNLPVVPSYRRSCAGGAAAAARRATVQRGAAGVGTTTTSSSPPSPSPAAEGTHQTLAARGGPTRGPLARGPSWAAGVSVAEPAAALSARQCRSLERWGMPTQREAFFEKDPDTNATQRIVTVAIYLQARCDARCVPPPRPWHACSLCARAPRVPRRILPAPSDAHRGPCMTQAHSTDPPSHLHRLSVCRTTPPTAAASRSSRARTARPTCTRGATASSCSRARRTSTCGCAPAGTRRLTIDVELDPSTVSQISLLHHTNPSLLTW